MCTCPFYVFMLAYATRILVYICTVYDVQYMMYSI